MKDYLPACTRRRAFIFLSLYVANKMRAVGFPAACRGKFLLFLIYFRLIFLWFCDSYAKRRFSNNEATVIGPIPPGTGVMARTIFFHIFKINISG